MPTHDLFILYLLLQVKLFSASSSIISHNEVAANSQQEPAYTKYNISPILFCIISCLHLTKCIVTHGQIQSLWKMCIVVKSV